MVKVVNNVCDYFFNYFQFGASKNHLNTQGFICLLNIFFSAWPLLCFILFTSDIHVVFWMGPAPQFINLAVPILLFIINIYLQYFVLCGHNSTASCAQTACSSLFIIIGAVLIGMGAFVYLTATQVADELTHHCGQTPRTAKLEAEWNKLNSFYEACDPQRQKQLTTCKGFRKAFPKKERVFVQYLQESEMDFACVGFCKYLAKPLFNKDSDLANRCSSKVGQHNLMVGNLVGSPTIGLGAFLLTVGACFTQYDHL